jgi:hypothetical protein
MSKKYDKCVICGKESPYTIETPIHLRIGYVEGAGQGCFNPGDDNCLINKSPYKKNQYNGEKMIEIPESVFLNTPNYMEFASIVKKIYHEKKKKETK